MLDKLKFKKIYRTNKDNVDKEFYIPCFSNSLTLKRAAGFFSLKSLLLSIDGLIPFVENNGSVDLICSPNLSVEDIKLIELGGMLDSEHITQELLSEITGQELSETEYLGLDLICNLIRAKRFNIKIAFMPLGIYHEKFGLFTDTNNDSIYFIGSMNATPKGHIHNQESITVHCSWNSDDDKEFVESEKAYFLSLWNGLEDDITVFDFPEALEKELLTNYKKSDSIEEAVKKYIAGNNNVTKKRLYPFQEKAISEFVSNGYRHFYEMATGTGKTFTSIRTIKKLQELVKENIFTVILVPQVDLQNQWYEALLAEGFENIYLFGGISSNTETQISNSVINYFNEEEHIVSVAVYDTFFDKVYDRLDNIENLFVVVDEAHNLNPSQLNKMPYAQYRLGLSATIQRFSKSETTKIIEYFTENEYEPFYYGIEDAIENNFLSQYEYYPIQVRFSLEEYNSYLSYTKSIATEFNKDPKDRDQDRLNKLLRDRSAIIKKAGNKVLKIQQMIWEGYDFQNSVVYCGQGKKDKDTEESIIDSVSKIFVKARLSVSQFTSKTIDRPRVLYEFEHGYYDTLIAIRCFDEGVDVPKLDKIYIMASDASLRQTVQRRGRVLRKCKESNKTIAYIYDMMILPPECCENDEYGPASLIINELRRTLEYNRLAINKDENQKYFDVLMEKYDITENDINVEYEDYEQD